MKIKATVDKPVTVDEETRTIEFCISSEAIDRDNEIILGSALRAAIPDFAKNPVALIGHQHKAPSNATVVGAWLVNTFRQERGKSYMRLKFAETPLAEEYWHLSANGFQRATSVGFATKNSERRNVNGQAVNVIVELELFEISLVAVPANADAVSKSVDGRRAFVAGKKGGFGDVLKEIKSLRPGMVATDAVGLASLIREDEMPVAEWLQKFEKDVAEFGRAIMGAGINGERLTADENRALCGCGCSAMPDNIKQDTFKRKVRKNYAALVASNV